jgi:Transcription factor Iwr1
VTWANESDLHEERKAKRQATPANSLLSDSGDNWVFKYQPPREKAIAKSKLPSNVTSRYAGSKTVPELSQDGVPIVQITGAGPAKKVEKKTELSPEVDTASATPRPKVEPRRFHLTSSKSKKAPISATSLRSKRIKQLAVFVEKERAIRKSASQLSLRAHNVEALHRAVSTEDVRSLGQPSSPRKKPQTRKTEAERVDQRKRTEAIADKETRDADLRAKELAANLQQMVMELSNTTTPRQTPLKYKPKPAPRKARVDGDPAMDIQADEDEDDGEWVEDVYIRQAVTSPKSKTESDQYGILVIRDEDQQEWEAFAEEVSDDSDDEDSEDSNGKQTHDNLDHY